MIDDGELDWKLIAIRTDDPLAATLHDVDDIEHGVVSGIREWFRWYKVPDNKPPNSFGHGERCLSAAEAVSVIEETHHHWNDLIKGTADAGKLWIPATDQ